MKAQPSQTRILLIHDHALFREGAARLLDAEQDLKVVGGCGSIEEALTILRLAPVDLVLLDVDLGKERGFQFFKPIRDNYFGGRVLVVAAVVSLFEARRLTQLGAAGIVLKQNPPHVLVDAIRAVIGGQFYIDPTLQYCLHFDADSKNTREALRHREHEVLSAIIEGLTNKEIAARVHISEALVKTTLQHLFEKYGVHTRSQLLRIALEQCVQTF